jgi:hypothetical protein
MSKTDHTDRLLPGTLGEADPEELFPLRSQPVMELMDPATLRTALPSDIHQRPLRAVARAMLEKGLSESPLVADSILDRAKVEQALSDQSGDARKV